VEGTPFGRYQLIELLGRGGMGEVWKAYDTTIDRVVALKMLLPHYAQDPDFETRFRREARAAARLDDPHVVPIHDVGEIDGRLYVTMRLINGVDLQTLLDAGPLEAGRAVHIIEQVASALNDAHQAGLVHRDVKPSNILLTHNDFAYLIDFGIARVVGETALTSANTTIGTWAYMAPERFSKGEIEPSSDIYALTCVLYQCLTGQPPYPGEALEQIAVGHMVAPPPRPSEERGTVPMAMDRVIATGLAKQPTDRYPSTVEMAAAARRAITAPATSPVPPVPPDSAQTQPWHTNRGAPPTMPARLGAPPIAPQPPNWAPAAKPPGRRRGVLIGALEAVAVLVVGGVIVGVTLTQRDNRATTVPPTTATPGEKGVGAPANTGAFTGTYRADFSAPTLIEGGPLEGTTPQTATWTIRSVCRPGGCVATASRVSGDGPPVTSLVFDQIEGRWFAVGTGSEQCQGAPAEIWVVLTLQPRPDGTLTGEATGTTSNTCSGRQTVTFTRTGDVDIDSLPDPASLPPRVVSPAEGLRGRYHSTRKFTGGFGQMEGDYQVVTNCLRTGDRCMSYFHAPADFRPLVFNGGTWTLDTSNEGKCDDGRLFDLRATGQYPMPQPSQDPIPQLTGHGHWEQTGACAVTTDFDETFTRTGD
jgi:predicted Ser/Thr protein kinase